MTKNTKRGLLVLFLLIVVFNMLTFLPPFEHCSVFWIGYAFGMFALLFQLYIFRVSSILNGSPRSRFYGFPILRLGIYYLIAQMILSLLELAWGWAITWQAAILLNVAITVAVIIGCVTKETIRDEIVRQDGQLKKNVAAMRELHSIAAALVIKCPDEETKKTIQKIADELRFSDPVSSDKTIALEKEIFNQLGDIQQALAENNTESIKILCDKLSEALAERNRVCSINK